VQNISLNFTQVEAIDQTCAVGTITFHIHGKRRPNAPQPTALNMKPNIVMFASKNLMSNPEATAGIRRLRDMFLDEIAVPYSMDWIRRAIRAQYLSLDAVPFASNVIDLPRDLISTPSQPWRSPVAPSKDRQHSFNNSDSDCTSSPTSHASSPKFAAGMHRLKSNVDGSFTDATRLAAPRLSPGVENETVAIPRDIQDLLSAIGKDAISNHSALHRIYHYTGRALWQSVVAEAFDLNEGTAKALVFLMNITTSFFV
jgi:hypothetical protein